MATSRPTADEYSKQQLRKLHAEGKLSQPLDDDTARDLLKTPPTTALVAPAAATEAPATSMRVGVTAGQLPASLGSQPLTTVLQGLEDEAAGFHAAMQQSVKVTQEHMQRSLLQLIEDTIRDRTADAGMEASLRATGSASIMGSPFPGTPSGAGARMARSFGSRASPSPAGRGTVSLRPVEGSRGMASRVGADALSDFVIPDAVRQHIAADVNTVLEHELQRLSSLVGNDAQRTVSCVLALSNRMKAAEEELLHANVELDVSAEQLAEARQRSEQLEKQIAEVQQHALEKDTQMDILREQIARRNASLDETRTRFRKEVTRYKARIFELESEVEGLSGKRRGEGRPVSIANEAVLDELADAPEEITAAVEAAVTSATARYEEQIRQMKIDWAREKKALISDSNSRVAERDHEIQRLKLKIKGFTDAAAGGKPAAKDPAVGDAARRRSSNAPSDAS